jgi:uncharacterized protein (TIGR03435 family)
MIPARLPALIALAAHLCAQSPSFEVASIKLHPMKAGARVFRMAQPGKPLFDIQGNRVIDEISTARELIMDAYGVKDYQIFGLPDWCIRGGDVYDIEARTAGDSPTVEQVRLMMQALLAERFELKLHREARELPVYELVIAKGGSKLKAGVPDEGPVQRGRSMMQKAMTSTVPMLISLLGNLVDRPIIDGTGLSGTYEYENLDWAGIKRAQMAPDSATPAESVFTAVQEKLGLKLEAVRAPTEVLVIERIARPSAN